AAACWRTGWSPVRSGCRALRRATRRNAAPCAAIPRRSRSPRAAGSSREPFAGRGKIGRVEIERVGGGDQVRFVGAEEVEHREVRPGLAERCPEGIGREPGEGEESLGPRCVRKDPGQRRKRQAGGVIYRIFRPVKNCQTSVKEIRLGRSASVGAEATGVANDEENPRCRGQRSQPEAVL